ncbi:MAG: hypothetical protein H6685_10205 [Deltaproteobacteria bacterium]|nr:hypothetical protein [Deltaproteobacteria bacterium]
MAVVALPACEKKTAPDDSHLVDLSRSTVRARNAMMVGYPGSRNRVSINLFGTQAKSRIDVTAPVRLGCKGASVIGNPQRMSTGVYAAEVEPAPDASTAICVATVGARILPNPAIFDILEPCTQSSPDEETSRSKILARRFAPIIYQNVGRQPRSDYLAAIDFDGNVNPRDNRDNLSAYPLVGAVYYSVVETSTNVFIIYAMFHPMSYGYFVDESAEATENDMTGLMVVLDRNHLKGPPVLVVTYLDGQFLHYSNDAKILPGTERVVGEIPFEDRRRPRVYVESGRHGTLITSELVIGEYTGEPGADFPGGQGIVYRPGRNVVEPDGPNDRNAQYRLVPLLDSLWKLREFVGERSVFTSTFRMDSGCTYPARFVSSEPTVRGGRPPWAWDDVDDGGVKVGEFFFWPAHTLATHLSMPESFDLQYEYNPYLGIR